MTITAAAVLAVSVLAAPLPAAGQPGAPPTIHNLGLFTIAMPPTWQIKPPQGDTPIQAISPAPPTGLPDTVEVVVRPLPSNVTDARRCESTVQWVMRVFQHKTFTTVSEGPLTIGGQPAYGQTYTWKGPNGEPRWSTQACIVSNGRAFVLTGTTANEPPGSPAGAPELADILNSFRLTGGAAGSP